MMADGIINIYYLLLIWTGEKGSKIYEWRTLSLLSAASPAGHRGSGLCTVSSLAQNNHHTSYTTTPYYNNNITVLVRNKKNNLNIIV